MPHALHWTPLRCCGKPSLKDIITIALALRALTWAVFIALQSYYDRQKEIMMRPLLNSCIQQMLDDVNPNQLWISEKEKYAPDATVLIKKFLDQLKDRQLALVPDLDLFNQIWLIKGEISGSFAVAAVFIIYGWGFSLVFPEERYALLEFHTSVGSILLHTGLILCVMTFVYALSFSARLQLRKAIMDMTLWESWKNRPR
jgi:hypothetical protein